MTGIRKSKCGGIFRAGGCYDFQIIEPGRNKNAVWSLLLAGGYLSVAETNSENGCGCRDYRLALKNREVHIMFEDMIHDWFTTPDVDSGDFVRALLAGDIKAMNYYRNRVALESFSYLIPERFYHGYVLGLMVDLNGLYTITSNRESGFGRYDVILEPKAGQKLDVIIIEFKVHDPEDVGNLSDTVAAALRQIEEKQYDAVLLARGIAPEKIRHFGFAFQGKQVLIG